MDWVISTIQNRSQDRIGRNFFRGSRCDLILLAQVGAASSVIVRPVVTFPN